MSEGSLAIIGMGSNQGDREAILDEAVEILRATPHVHVWTVSRYYETTPVGGPPGQAPFLNAALLTEPVLDPLSLLERLHEVEARLGRVRDERWGARTLDLDLLLYGQEVRRTPQITVPHPRLPFRRFALVPAVEIAPWSLDPLTNMTVNELLASLDRRPSLIAVAAANPDDAGAVELASEVHSRIVQALGAESLRRDALKGDPPSGFPAHPRDRLFAEVRAAAHRMPESKWRQSGLGDRWLAADFALDLELRRAASMEASEPAVDEGRWKGVWNLFTYERAAAAAVDRALTPTFVVLIGREAAAIRDGGFPRPVLVPESSDPAAIVAEAVVACHATRA
ncbi:2-amino-4-hydroxy-6-hydroxymethyldihydropteridine diphosphokinase [Paludisphaera mucosa]|uniref:2-amino-4-hydroxy-6-hydroxymethyldihydropteridine pyrophosphokinase n=1 Tax=Paludisphaera mucosa TaxID=3030827 RepID=A0ABT6FH02_9BACT|nr:2-amino-4-hydroxy-6-hydroxymethyldihydropteridine diphosphokinase [Paludisphaera mucosa]MDG3006852.1 2-amino-4-hydroxy-6-hydroxymethyldihydropteridine diphosphokinase [Paludisphaera mucosa]